MHDISLIKPTMGNIYYLCLPKHISCLNDEIEDQIFEIKILVHKIKISLYEIKYNFVHILFMKKTIGILDDLSKRI